MTDCERQCCEHGNAGYCFAMTKVEKEAQRLYGNHRIKLEIEKTWEQLDPHDRQQWRRAADKELIELNRLKEIHQRLHDFELLRLHGLEDKHETDHSFDSVDSTQQ